MFGFAGVLAGVPSAHGLPPGGASGASSSPDILQTGGSINYRFDDFFNVPYGEWWDYRFASYGDLPINAECFNATSIADGVCIADNPAVPDFETYPYTNWYPLPGPSLNWVSANPLVYTGYRMNVVGTGVPGYNRSEPVFLPVLNYAEPAGGKLDFRWQLQYLDKATGDALTNDPVDPCPGVDPAGYDGFYVRSQVELTMDLQQSRRMFNVVATDAASARTWWATNSNPMCALQGTAERNVQTWFITLGGTSRVPGKYNVANSFEWFYVSFYLDIDATVDDNGDTHVRIDHTAWGTEVVLARMFYWGNASYLQNYLDSTKAEGWWGMELAWFEGLDFMGSLGAPGAGFDFTLNSAMHYHFQHLATAGPNGVYDQIDDVPYWTWGPVLSDYTNNYFPNAPQSELDRYPTATYIHSTPGSKFYGDALPYDYAPIKWDLPIGQSWSFQFPTRDVVLYNPNLTPSPANPEGSFVEIVAPLARLATNPADYGLWDATTKTWTVTGLSLTGGPVGSPGDDGVPGTADDQYALEPWGAIQFGVAAPKVANANLIGRSGWPERHHFVLSNDAVMTLNGKVGNLGNVPVLALVEFKLYDSTGAPVATLRTATMTIDPGMSAVLTSDWTAALGKYSATAQVWYDSDGDGDIDAPGAKVKSFGFSVVP